MDSCSPFPRGQASQERRWGVDGARPLPRPRDGFLLPVSTRTSPGKTVGRRGEMMARPLPRPRDGFLLSQERRWGVGGRWSGGLSRVPGMDSCFRRKDGGASGGDGAGASPASQGWIPAPRFHEDKLRRKDGGASSCPRKRVPRGGRWGRGMDSCSPFPRGQASQERRWNHVVPAQAGTQRGEMGPWIPAPAFPGMDSRLRRKDGGASGADGAGPP